ncbi:MAG: hypothetical protein ABI127_03555 [Dokdonella sp.]
MNEQLTGVRKGAGFFIAMDGTMPAMQEQLQAMLARRPETLPAY